MITSDLKTDYLSLNLYHIVEPLNYTKVVYKCHSGHAIKNIQD